MSRLIAKKVPHLRFVVQDLAQVIEQVEEPSNADRRISYQIHSFFDPQLVKDADVYYCRRVFHDWPDKHSARILKALVPSMKPGSRLIIGDAVVPAVGTAPRALEEMLRLASLHLMVVLAGKERELSEWTELVEGASDGEARV